MKKKLLLAILLFLIPLCLPAALFPDYDFTFFKSIEDTLAVLNNERFGFDYSGYGFVGENMTSGIYIRIGVQMPYSIFFSSSSNENKDTEGKKDNDETIAPPSDTILEQTSDEAITANVALEEDIKDQTNSGADGKVAKIKTYDYKFAISLGPSFRRFIGNQALWYMGIGLTATTEGRTTGSGSVSTSSLDVRISSEFDIGFRIDASKKNTSLRIGVYGSLDLISFSSVSTVSQESSSTEMALKADIFTPLGEKSAFSAVGYISLGHTFKNTKDDVRYIYSNKTRTLGKGVYSQLPQ